MSLFFFASSAVSVNIVLPADTFFFFQNNDCYLKCTKTMNRPINLFLYSLFILLCSHDLHMRGEPCDFISNQIL